MVYCSKASVIKEPLLKLAYEKKIGDFYSLRPTINSRIPLSLLCIISVSFLLRANPNTNYHDNVALKKEVLSKLVFFSSTKEVPFLERRKTINIRLQYSALQFKITGAVIDKTGTPLAGATIAEKGTDNGVQTDMDGNYTIEVSSEKAILEVSYIGFITKKVAVKGKSEITITLQQENIKLDPVVVVGYGTVRKSDLTGSISQISSKEVTSIPSSNSVMHALQGRAAGVQVSQNTGAPGAGINVRIRGANSIQGNNDPLYVIDGFPYSGSPTNLNNSDIESIEVLKDASATAIYGSRGANGVVMITTQRGRDGATKVEFETSVSTQELRSKLNLLNGSQYASFVNLQAQNDGINPYFTPDQIKEFGEGFDWQDFVFETGYILSNSLNISGGNEKTQFSVGASTFDNNGIINGSDYNRYSFRINLDHQISDQFRIKSSNSLTYLDTGRKDSGGGSRGNTLIGAAISAAPISSPYNADGSYRILSNEYPFVAPDIINPINFIEEQTRTVKANVVLSNLAFIYNPITDITVNISGGIENRDDRTDLYTSRNFVKSNGFASVNTTQRRSLLSENTISYDKHFNNSHAFSLVVGLTYQNFKTTYLAANGSGFLSDAFESYQIQSAITPGIPSSGYAKSDLLSYLGRINYTFKDKYLLTMSMRRDGSSRYSEGNKWGNFPSAAIAWKVNEEDFIKNMNVFSDLKIRGSWGKTGSQAIDPYTTLNILSPGKTVFDDDLYTTFAPGTRLPGNLKWETTKQLDVGMDLGFFDNRLTFTLDYYKKNTTDLLNTVNLPTSTGYTSTIRNIGEVMNEGVEIGIKVNPFSGDFNWVLSANISANRNEVIKLNDGQDILGSYISALVVQDNVSILREGRPIGQFWGYVEDGYDENGQIRLMDLNKDGSISSEDKTYIGNPNPDFTFGLNSDINYKNMSLSFFMQGSMGNDIFNASSIPVTLDYGQGMNTLQEVLWDSWSPTNVDAKYPLISRNTSAYVSDRWIENGSYLRLKNIELAYSIPIKNIFIRKAQVYISGQNLLTITSYSWWYPEVNSLNSNTPGIDYLSYPIARSYTVGLRMEF